jgi:putative transposase
LSIREKLPNWPSGKILASDSDVDQSGSFIFLSLWATSMSASSDGTRKRKRALSTAAQKKTETGNVRGPFWGQAAAALAPHLWMPTGTFQKQRMSWFSTAILQASPPGQQSYDPSALDDWLMKPDRGPSQVNDKSVPLKKKARVDASPTNHAKMKTQKIRVYPANEDQRKILLQWFGTARWTYNECLKKLRLPNSPYKPNRNGGLREAVVNNDNYVTENQWVLDTPRDIRAGAYDDLLAAHASNFAKTVKTPAHSFEIRERSRKQPQQSIYIDRRSYNKGVIYASKFGTVPLRSTEPLPDRLAHDAHLIRTRLGHYYLCISVDVRRDDRQVPSDTARIAAIDPGIRTPHMLYDPSGIVIGFGEHAIGRIYRLCHYLDQLRSKMDQLPKKVDDPVSKKDVHRKRWRMRKAWHRASLRIRNLVDEYHKQVVHHLVTNYDIVLLPALETSRLVLRKTRKLGSKTARAMVAWAHYRFRQRLLWKAPQADCKVVICGEEYTSKTCGKCGWMHTKLEGSKTFNCQQCHLSVDRDVNGARNILLKNASRFGFRVESALGITPSAVVNRAVHGSCSQTASARE